MNVPSTLPSLLHYDGTPRQFYEILTSSAINIEDKLEACHRLSVIYKEGYGTQQDMDLSIKYLCEGINLFYDFSMFQPNDQNQAVNVKDFQENEFYFKLIKDFTLQCDLLNTVPIFATHACSAFETIKTFTDRIPREEKDDILGKAWYMQGYCHAKGIGGVWFL